MRHTGGGSWVCLALLGVVACSSADPPPPEGSTRGTVVYAGATDSAEISGGVPPNLQNDVIGNTVLDGRNGFHVSCSVTGGSSYSISGEISAPGGVPDIQVGGSGITAQGGKVAMYFTVIGAVTEVFDTACTLQQVKALQAGSIWASFQCSNVQAQSSLGSAGTATGEFVFTGCTGS